MAQVVERDAALGVSREPGGCRRCSPTLRGSPESGQAAVDPLPCVRADSPPLPRRA